MPTDWTTAHEYEDIRYEHSGTGIAKITIDRQHVRNAFRPKTVTELIDAFARVRDDASIGVPFRWAFIAPQQQEQQLQIA